MDFTPDFSAYISSEHVRYIKITNLQYNRAMAGEYVFRQEVKSKGQLFAEAEAAAAAALLAGGGNGGGMEQRGSQSGNGGGGRRRASSGAKSTKSGKSSRGSGTGSGGVTPPTPPEIGPDENVALLGEGTEKKL